MSDTQKTIRMLEEIPDDISSKLSMKEIFETLSIMLVRNDSDVFEPTIEDFFEALSIRIKINQGLKDIENGNVYTTEELKKELGIWKLFGLKMQKMI